VTRAACREIRELAPISQREADLKSDKQKREVKHQPPPAPASIAFLIDQASPQRPGPNARAEAKDVWGQEPSLGHKVHIISGKPQQHVLRRGRSTTAQIADRLEPHPPSLMIRAVGAHCHKRSSRIPLTARGLVAQFPYDGLRVCADPHQLLLTIGSQALLQKISHGASGFAAPP